MVGRDDGRVKVDGYLTGVLDGSIIPTLLVEARTGVIFFVNKATLGILSMEREDLEGSFLHDISHPEDAHKLASAVVRCADVGSQRRFLRHRFVGAGNVQVQGEVVVAGCWSHDGPAGIVLVQIRNLAIDSSIHSFLRFIADNPEGDSVAGALRHGLFAGLPVDSVSIYSINRERTLALLRGASGLSASARRDYAVSPVNLAAPGGVVTLTMELLWVSLTELTRRFPLLASDFTGTAWFETGEAICLPVVSRGKVIGTMFLVLRETVERRWHLHEMFHSAAQSLAPWMLLQEISEGAKPAPARTGKLLVSERELAVLRLVDSGTANADIAEQLGYSEATVRADLQRLSRLVSANGRREVVRRARELGLYEG